MHVALCLTTVRSSVDSHFHECMHWTMTKSVDGFEQSIACAGLKFVDIMEEVERAARWREAGVRDPFDGLRAEREKHLSAD